MCPTLEWGVWVPLAGPAACPLLAPRMCILHLVENKNEGPFLPPLEGKEAPVTAWPGETESTVHPNQGAPLDGAGQRENILPGVDQALRLYNKMKGETPNRDRKQFTNTYEYSYQITKSG